MCKYDYLELKAKAAAPNATKKDLENLWNWFETYGNRYWNGECYDADDFLLYPVYEHDAENDQYEVIGYEIR